MARHVFICGPASLKTPGQRAVLISEAGLLISLFDSLIIFSLTLSFLIIVICSFPPLNKAPVFKLGPVADFPGLYHC